MHFAPQLQCNAIRKHVVLINSTLRLYIDLLALTYLDKMVKKYILDPYWTLVLL